MRVCLKMGYPNIHSFIKILFVKTVIWWYPPFSDTPTRFPLQHCRILHGYGLLAIPLILTLPIIISLLYPQYIRSISPFWSRCVVGYEWLYSGDPYLGNHHVYWWTENHLIFFKEITILIGEITIFYHSYWEITTFVGTDYFYWGHQHFLLGNHHFCWTHRKFYRGNHHFHLEHHRFYWVNHIFFRLNHIFSGVNHIF